MDVVWAGLEASTAGWPGWRTEEVAPREVAVELGCSQLGVGAARDVSPGIRLRSSLMREVIGSAALRVSLRMPEFSGSCCKRAVMSVTSP